MTLDEREARRKKSVVAHVAGVEQEKPAPALAVQIKPKEESRSRKANFLFKPSVFTQAQEKAQAMNTSLNEIMNQLLEAWLDG